MIKHNRIMAGIILLLFYLPLQVAADNSEFRLQVAGNSAVLNGDFNLDLEMRIAEAGVSPRPLNSLTMDIRYPASLSAYADTCAVNWALSPGYEATVSKLAGYYRVLVTANGVPALGAAWPVTSKWQKLVTLRWKIATVTGSYNIAMSDTTDAAAYFSAAPPSDLAEWNTALKAPADLRVNAKLFLQGAYSAASHVMTTTLLEGHAIPLTSPYGEDSRSLGAMPPNTTDWILLQLRSAASGATVASKSAQLLNNGQVVADDGSTSEIVIPSLEGEKEYYLLARHRNHLAVMSSTMLALNKTAATVHDFTSGLDKYYRNNAKNLEPGVYGLYSGDANADGYINAIDKVLYWRAQNGSIGYKTGDFNLDRYVNAIDNVLYWRVNNGKMSSLP